MKKKLKIITEKTIKDLLINEIILPSSYFTCFAKHLKDFNINLKENKEMKESKNLILEEFNTINAFMNSTIKSIHNLSTVTKQAKIAIINKDNNSLDNLQVLLRDLEKDLLSLQDEIYKDSFSKTYNRKWVYKYILNKEGCFNKSGSVVLIDLYDYNTISKKFSTVLADNLLIFVLNHLNKNLKEENIEYECIRYYQDTFLFLCNKESLDDLKDLFTQIQEDLCTHKLKNKKGIVIQPRFNFSCLEYKKEEDFTKVLEELHNQIN